MDEKELMTNESTNDTPEELNKGKQAAVAQMENIFEQISEIKAEMKEVPTKERDEKEELPTEIEVRTLTTESDAEKEEKERKFMQERAQKNKRMLTRAAISIAVAATVIFGGYFYADYIPKGQGETVVITIPKGSGTVRIASELKKNNLINSEGFYRVMSKLRGIDGKYNFGKYEIKRGSGYEKIFKILTQPSTNIDAVRVTIPEGYEIYKIADLLEEKGLIDKDKFYYLVDYGNFDYDFVKEIPQRPSRLEGYLFPDTYEFVPNDEYGIINEMLGKFEQVYSKYKEQAASTDMTMDEIITLASIVEREAQGDHDRSLVSSVFHNRIKSPDYPYLQSCATVQYVLKERKPVLSLADTKIDSPYNTYINKGLPIGPIASPGEKSIAAAINPAESDYLFFVMGSDGKHHFSTTFNEHIQNKNN